MNQLEKITTISKFDGNDFPVWKAQIESIMEVKELSHLLTSSKPRKSGTDAEKAAKEVEIIEWEKKDKQVKSFLLLSLDNKHVRIVLKCKSSKEIWDRLTTMHEQRSSASKIVKQKEFFDLQMKYGEEVQDFISRAEYLYGILKDVGVTGIDESTLVNKIVSGLPRRYMNFISNWGNQGPESQKLSHLLPKLLAEDELLQKFKRKDETVLVGESSNDNKSRRKGGHHHTGNNSNHNNRNKKTDKKWSKNNAQKKHDKKCYYCKEEGHFKKECPKLKEKNKQEPEKEEDPKEVSAIIADSCYTESTSEWILDSGATEHMSYERSSFVNYTTLNPYRKIRYGNFNEGKGIGIGDIPVQVKSGSKTKNLILKNVLYVPDMRRKLLSVSAITESGGIGEIKRNSIVVKNSSGLILFEADKIGKLYMVNLKEMIESEADATETDSPLNVWHERLCHLNKRTIVKMVAQNSVLGLDGIDPKQRFKKGEAERIDCQVCSLSKMTKKTFPSSRRKRSERAGEIWHVDVCGPIGTETYTGAKYVILFKDEFSNFRYIYFMKTKEEVYDSIRRCIAQAEFSGKTVKGMVSDCGSEFMSKRTQSLFLDKGIVHNTSAPFTPSQNGFIERDNRTLMEATRALLFSKNLPEKLWGEAASTVVYTLNRTINKNTIDKTPYEIYLGVKPDLRHLKVFGSLAIVKAQEKKRSGYQKKLDARGFKGILVGYERAFTYRIFDPKTSKIVISRDVVFDETKTLELRKKNKYKTYESCIDSLPVHMLLEEEELDENEDDIENRNDESFHSVEEGNLSPPRAGFEDESDTDGEALIADGEEPQTFIEAVKSPDAKFWKRAMQEEFDSLIQNKTFDLVSLPEGRKPITCKWVFKIKRNTDGSIERYKCRLVARGFSQKAGIDYHETFSPVARLDSIRLILSIVAKEDLDLIHFDVATAFLYGKLDEEIYMSQPEGFERNKSLFCKLNKSIYGLKQASKVWNECFRNFLRKFDLKQINKDSCIFIKEAKDSTLMLALYVDDGLLCSNNQALLKETLNYLKTSFNIKVMDAKCFVGLQIERNRRTRQLFIHQKYYVERTIKRFKFDKCRAFTTPANSGVVFCKSGTIDEQEGKMINLPYREAIGCLIYISNGTRPDICYIVNKLASYCACPKSAHWKAVQRVFSYLNNTSCFGICYGEESDLIAYSDADFASDVDSRRSTSGIVIKLHGGAILWYSKKQATVAKSTTEAEVIAASLACSEIVWCRQFLQELGKGISKPTKLLVDNQGSIKLILNQQVHSKIKHLDIKLLFCREVCTEGKINLLYTDTKSQTADILTKNLSRQQFQLLREKMGLREISLLLTIATCVLASSGENTGSKRRVTLKIESPCEDMKSAQDSDNLDFWNVYESRIYNVFSKDMCDEKFKEASNLALAELENCPIHRAKRGLPALAFSVLKTLGRVAVTDFVRGSVRDGDLHDDSVVP